MALISAWPLFSPILFFLRCLSSSTASSEGSIFQFDIEGSSAVSTQEATDIRGQQQPVATGSWVTFAEECQEGFYRTSSGKCSPCNCNGNANRCLDGSGICVDCQRNTTGQHCEQCPDGFIGDVVRGVPTFCQPCPCPLPEHSNFAVSCYRKSGSVRCVCKENYAGPNCERCAPGYYGNPLLIGSTCKKCDCNGNSDPNMIFEDCDEVTGQCRNCLHNTSGFKCERCAPGYYGDARFAKNCTACNCGGRMCDSQTGECLADSPEASTDTDCPTISCDKCIWDLTDDIRLSVLAIDESKSTLLSISTGLAAQKRLNDLNLTTTHLQEAMSKKKSSVGLWTIKVEDAADEMNDLLRDATTLDEQGSEASSKGLLVQKETIDTNNRATQLVQQLNNIRDNIEEISSKSKYYAIQQQQELSPDEVAQKRSVVEEMLKEIKLRKPFTNQRQLADEEENAAEKLLQQIEAFHEKYNDTRSLVSDVLEQLSEQNVKLSDLEEALDQALDYVLQTEDINKENTASLQRREKQLEKVKKQIDEVNSILLSATTILEEPQKVNSDLSEVIKNASGLYAEIDGAKKELQEKIANLSLFDDELVEKAMHHTHNLRRLADELDGNLYGVDSNGLVQRAINASNVYENIAGYIEEASKAALLALNTTNRVKDAAVGIDTQVIYHKGKSEELLIRAMQLQRTAHDSSDYNIADTSWQVNGTFARMNVLRNQLMRAISKMQSADTVAARERLEQAKQKTAEAVSATMTVTEATTPMGENIRLWSQNLQDFQHTSEAYDNAVHSAGDAVKKLTEVFPELLDKLRRVEQKAPANNISSSIQRIRELIAQTRSVASKVQVSMMFGGQSAVEVNPKINVEELKSFTSMSLYIKLQKENPQLAASPDRFILYLGNKNAKHYIGLAIKNDNLVYIYNLGGQDVEIPLDAKPVSTWPSYFSIIKIERIGRHGKMFLTVPSLSSTDEEKFIKKGEVLGPGSLLNLEPENAVFYVGGVPPGFKLPPSLNLPGFIGCLELATLNNDVISLYNFKHVYNIDTTTSPPCARDKLAFTQSRAVSYFFDGSGYALARNIERRGRFSQVTRFDIEVRTPTDNGLILLMINGSMFFSLEMHNGFLYLRYDFGFSNGPVLLEDSMKKAQINDAKFHEISIIYHNSKKMILVVDRRHIKSVDNERTAMPFTDIYIGGAPAEILHSSISSHLAGSIGFKGCMKGFQFQKKDFNLLEEPGTLGISYGCPEDSLMSRNAYFNGESFIASSQKASLFTEFEGGFNFRTLQPSGLLFYYSEGSDVLSISMDRGAVVLNASGTKIQSSDRNYNDGKTHFIITSVTPERYELTVDDKKQSKKNPGKDRAGKSPDSIKKFYFGGSPLRTQQANFTGCISNAYFTRLDEEVEVEDFQKYSEKVQTSLYGCPVESPPVALLHKKGKNSSKAKGNRNKKVEREKDKISQPSTGLKKLYQVNMQRDPQCHLLMNPKATEHAYQFGGTANSRQEFDHIPKDFSQRAQFSISLKTHSSHGMIFYISDQKETNFMALFVAHGRLVFMFNAGQQKIRIKSQEKYNDGLWHDVIFTRGKNSGHLIIDGLRVLEESFGGNTNAWQVTAPLYIGGVAPGKAVKNIQINSVYSFNGCLSNLQLNGRPITSASQTFSVTPCFEGPSEAGTYFSSEGGYVVLDESFSLGLKFEVVFEIRPRSSSGILLHGHSVNGEYLNMHMRNGQVTVKLNNGIRDFSTSVTLKQSLCDGRWHRIAVIRDANVVQLDVDSEVNHVVGPLNPKAIDHREPVFIGGVPESLLTTSLTTRNSFIGCIRNFMIDEKPVSFSKAALVSGAVSINTCPAA
ncbi:laminin subunit alpha-4 isoform X2 [Myiozetetes cayanensis]|uniref:laminin subunit alpha-4 isoform X2 n=1 Tax=Myiozetetes cayanensis TaxID=478635 RepID=UPI00215DD908|nr:laminin subunit alpha-4 isoform X2 [Myiozetetes cayanensis]